MVSQRRIQITTHKDNQVSVSKEGIEIKHEGKPVSGTASTGHVYLIIDCSSSMEGDKLRQARKGALRFAREALSKGYFTGLIGFDSSPALICEPCKEISILKKQVKTLGTGDTTHMAKAIHLASNLLGGISGSKVMVIVTDGMPNGPDDPKSSLKAGESAKRRGIDIIAIGTDDADQGFLRKLASRSELGMKVTNRQLERTITSSAKLLPGGSEDRSGR